MDQIRPHYLLFCDGSLPNTNPDNHSYRGRWRFVLEEVDGGQRFEASDAEAAVPPDRMALLAVVRGLEALEQPSRVTLVTTSRYVNRGLQYGLPEWRENEYCWEHFGALQPIRNADLWQRIDGALRFHEVQCRLMAGSEHSEADVLIEGVSLPSNLDEKIHVDIPLNLSAMVAPVAEAEMSIAVTTEKPAETSSPLIAGVPIHEIGLTKLLRVWFHCSWRRWIGAPLTTSTY